MPGVASAAITVQNRMTQNPVLKEKRGAWHTHAHTHTHTHARTYDVGGKRAEGYTMIIIICIVVYYAVCVCVWQPRNLAACIRWRRGGGLLIPLISWSIERRRRRFPLIVHRGRYYTYINIHNNIIHDCWFRH